MTSTRRAFLKSAPLAAVAAATPAMAVAMATDEELPVTKVNRLGWELAKALNDYADGRMHAVIYPSNERGFAVGFEFDFQETQEEKVKRLILNLQCEMSKLPPVDTEGGAAHEVKFGGKAFLRMADASRTQDNTLVMIGFIPRLGAPTTKYGSRDHVK